MKKERTSIIIYIQRDIANTHHNLLNNFGKETPRIHIHSVIHQVIPIAFLITSGLYMLSIGPIVNQKGITTIL